jgi:hypothetical protein
LSDPQRRKEYDILYTTRSDRTDNPQSTYNFFSLFANLFGGGTSQTSGEGAAQPNADGVFADVFEEVRMRSFCSLGRPLHELPQLLRPEVEQRVPIWGWVGAACGGGIGFIVANVPGLMLGAFAGNRLGAVRDAKGKSVAAVFSELSGNQRAEVNIFIRTMVPSLTQTIRFCELWLSKFWAPHCRSPVTRYLGLI